MSPNYRDQHTLADFSGAFRTVVPLEKDWSVCRQFGKIHLCYTDPGVSFSPQSTMTYVFERIDGNWYLTGEAEMFLALPVAHK
jgi:hypothetical protein